MRPSEVKRRPAPLTDEKAKPFRASSRANPPISREDARGAPVVICRRCGGYAVGAGDKDGNVYYCPLGKMHWRWTPRSSRDVPLPMVDTGALRIETAAVEATYRR